MILYNPFFEPVVIPDKEEEIIADLEVWKDRYRDIPNKHSQSMIDSLEYALDLIRREKDV